MKTDNVEYFEIEAQHFLMEYFAEVPMIHYTISEASPLTERYDEIREFIGDDDIRDQYNKVKAELKKAVSADEDDNTILYNAYKLEDILFREYHPRHPIYDITNQGFCLPESPEGWLATEVMVEYPPQANNE